jgi:hypothetical protein
MMKRDELARASTPEPLVEHVARNAPAVRQAQHDHGGATESVREATYRGHHLVIRTSYHIEVDGVPVEGHLGVTNDGQVHYHAVPNLSFASAVDLVKQLIDTFPEDFQARPEGYAHREEP